MECKGDIMSEKSLDEILEMKEKQYYLSKHPNKIWQGSDSYWRTYVGSSTNRKLVKRRTEDDLKNYICQYYKLNEFNPTVSELFHKWVEQKYSNKEITEPTKDRYICDYNRHLKGTELARTAIKTVTEDDLDRYVRNIIATGEITAHRFANIRTIIFGIFKYAKRQHLTDISITNFFKDLDISKKVFKTKPINIEGSVFNEDEIPRLFDYLMSHPCPENYGIILAFRSGLRCGELAALKFSDYSDNVLHVQRQEIVYTSGVKGQQIHAVVDYTKTAAGNRYIYLPESCSLLLTSLHWMNKDGEFIFEKDGRRIYKTSFNNYLKKACKEVDIPLRTMHKIRRTYGTTLIDNNVEDSLIMSQMGHSDISTTRKYYYYANKNDKHKREQINASIIF